MAATADNPDITADNPDYTADGSGPPPVVSSVSLAYATVGFLFNYQIAASNDPTGFLAAGLPAGLTLNPATGLISGVPTHVGTTLATVSATNDYGTGTLLLVVAVLLDPGQVLAGVDRGDGRPGTLQPVYNQATPLSSGQLAAIGSISDILAKLTDSVPGDTPVYVLPQPPSNPTLGVVFGYLQTPDGAIARNVELTFSLRTPAAIRSNRVVAGRDIKVTSDDNGLFTRHLERNDLLTPAGSQWVVKSRDLGWIDGKTFTLAAATLDVMEII